MRQVVSADSVFAVDQHGVHRAGPAASDLEVLTETGHPVDDEAAGIGASLGEAPTVGRHHDTGDGVAMGTATRNAGEVPPPAVGHQGDDVTDVDRSEIEAHATYSHGASRVTWCWMWHWAPPMYALGDPRDYSRAIPQNRYYINILYYICQ